MAKMIFKKLKKVMKILNLVHPVHGVVRSRYFPLLFKRKDTKAVLKVVDRWRKMYGKKFLECSCEWED